MNGFPVGFFRSTKGLRQGDSLSLYLFVIGMEVFNRLIGRAMEGNFMSRYKVSGRGEEGLVLTHLLYADDALIFYRVDQIQLIYLRWLLIWFEALSMLRINLSKSEIIPIGRVDDYQIWL